MSYFIKVDLETGKNLHQINQDLLPLTRNGIHTNLKKRVLIRFFEPNATARSLYNPQFNTTDLTLCVSNPELMEIIKSLEYEIPRLNKPLEKPEYPNCFKVKIKNTTFVHYDNSKEKIDLINPLTPFVSGFRCIVELKPYSQCGNVGLTLVASELVVYELSNGNTFKA